MKIARRLDALHEIYAVYDNFIKGLTMACKRGCATCCTQNVTMTTLEGYSILQHLIASGKTDLLKAVHHTVKSKRYQPALTTNELAALCLNGEDPPEEKNDYSSIACPFLCNNECLIYEERPLGCRCFFSAEKCETAACAVVEPFFVTVNTVFLQFVEHIDAGGLFGNMSDVLLFLEPEITQTCHETYSIVGNRVGLSHNRPIPALLAPPEHQMRLEPVLRELSNIPL